MRQSWKISGSYANWRMIVCIEPPDDANVADVPAWPFDKLVMMSFPDEASFQAFSSSAAYQDISRDRKAGAQATVLLVKGFTPGG